MANPKDFVGYASYDGDQYILVKVKTNSPFIYYAGAGWDKSKHFQQKEDWFKYIDTEANAVDFKDRTSI